MTSTLVPTPLSHLFGSGELHTGSLLPDDPIVESGQQGYGILDSNRPIAIFITSFDEFAPRFMKGRILDTRTYSYSHVLVL